MMKESIRRHIIALCLATCTLAAGAVTLQQAKALYQKEKYEEALVAFEELYKKSASNKKNASINHWLGVCLYKTGSTAESEKYFEYAASKSVAESKMYLSKIAYSKHEFDKAYSYMEEYVDMMREADKEISEEASLHLDAARSAKSMYEHVEKIVIIDSLVVDKQDFFLAYKISPETGRFVTSDILPYAKPDSITSVFIPENGDRMMWVGCDSVGGTQLMESNRLLDNSWEEYQAVDGNLNLNGDIAYPFMMPDGSTLYYSSNGDGSLGGYDIFMSRKNSEDGSFFQPQNLGMPYNSPYDDYLLVIDEVTGLGWWATDRNQIPGKLTIYVFIPNEVRENYSIDDPNLYSYANVNSIKDTWDEGADYSEYFERLEAISKAETTDAVEFEFEVAKGVIYTSLDDAKTSEGRNYLEQYLEVKESLTSAKAQLKELRKEYAEGSASERKQLKSKILNLENAVIKREKDLKSISNNVIKIEGKRNKNR